MLYAKIASVIGAILLGAMVVLSVLLVLGFPLGELTMGGKNIVLPYNMRIIVGIMIAIQIIALVIVLQTSGAVPLLLPLNITRIICFVFAVYLSFNSIMNLFSDSIKEKLIMTPLAAIAAICFWITALAASNME